MSRRVRTVRWAAVAGMVVVVGTLASVAGPLDPPAGPVAPTGKTLTEVEPRTAINAVNTPGDADSVFRIAQPGSYYLTGNVTGVGGRIGIEIAANEVTIDLMGYSLRGSGGSLAGIHTQSGTFNNITIRNGVVAGWGTSGLQLAGSGSVVENIHATDNCVGIFVMHSAIVRSCTASRNACAGIGAGDDSVIEACTCSHNGAGIAAGFRSTVRGCVVSFSDVDYGINVNDSSTIAGCSLVANRTDAIRVSAGCRVTGNNCTDNGNGGDGAGIHALLSDNQILDNNCSRADRGIEVALAGNFVARNTCTGNTADWVIAANNVVGPILDRRAPASAAINGFSAPDSTGSTHPNANFSY